jgi:FtsZ-binding cell division protein ZapB
MHSSFARHKLNIHLIVLTCLNILFRAPHSNTFAWK